MWVWVYGYSSTFWGDEHQFASHFDVQYGTRLLTPCHMPEVAVVWRFHFAFCGLMAYSMVCKDRAKIDYPGHGRTGHNARVLLQAFPIALLGNKKSMGSWFWTKRQLWNPCSCGPQANLWLPRFESTTNCAGPEPWAEPLKNQRSIHFDQGWSDYRFFEGILLSCLRRSCPRISPLMFLRAQPTTRMDRLRKSPSAAQNFALTPALVTASWNKCDGGQMTADLESAHTNVFCKLLSSIYGGFLK